MKKDLEELKELLIVVDVLNGFIRNGSLADPSVGHIIPEIENLVKDFIERKQGIIFVKDCHDEGCVEFNTFPPHCVKGTDESELVDELRKYEDYGFSIEKNSTSAIVAPGFLTLIDKMRNLKRVVGVGCESDICVPNLFIPLKNYFNQVNKDVEIVIPLNAIETYDSPSHPREKYSDASCMLMEQAGLTLVKKYERR